MVCLFQDFYGVMGCIVISGTVRSHRSHTDFVSFWTKKIDQVNIIFA